MKCINCKTKERHSTHGLCKYCEDCKNLLYLEGVKRGIKKWRSKSKEHLNAYMKKNNHKWKESKNLRLYKKRANLDDSYIVWLLTRKNSLLTKDIPKELIELKRLDLLLMRNKTERKQQCPQNVKQ